jgi:predicted nucleic acid-binding protein
MAARGAAKLVLDASAVVRIIEASPQGVAMGEELAATDLVLAPELMLTEVANAFWRLERAGQIEAAIVQQRFERCGSCGPHRT